MKNICDPKKRIFTLLAQSKTYQEFRKEAIIIASWALAPYVAEGHRVDNVWLEAFWNTHKKA